MALKTAESFFLAYREGRLTRDMYETEELHQGDFFAYPGMQAAWDIRKHYFHKAFQRWADERIGVAKKNQVMPLLYREGVDYSPPQRAGA
jgi:hypothetical protein